MLRGHGFVIEQAVGINYGGESVARGVFDAGEFATKRGVFHEIADCYLLSYVCRRPTGPVLTTLAPRAALAGGRTGGVRATAARRGPPVGPVADAGLRRQGEARLDVGVDDGAVVRARRRGRRRCAGAARSGAQAQPSARRRRRRRWRRPDDRAHLGETGRPAHVVQRLDVGTYQLPKSVRSELPAWNCSSTSCSRPLRCTASVSITATSLVTARTRSRQVNGSFMWYSTPR